MISLVLPRLLESNNYEAVQARLFESSRPGKFLKAIYDENGKYQSFLVTSDDTNETEENDPTLGECMSYFLKACEGVISMFFKRGFTIRAEIGENTASKEEDEDNSLKSMRVSEDFLWQKLGEREDDNDLLSIRNDVIETMITLLSTQNYINV